jgi:hypothetical protein
MTDISDAYEAAYTIMLNLTSRGFWSKGFLRWKPDYIACSNYLVLKIYDNGKRCTFPHATNCSTKNTQTYLPYLRHTPNSKIIYRRSWMRG